MNPAIRRKGEHRLATCTNGSVRPYERIAETDDVVERHDAAGQDKAAIGPVDVERGNLLGDGAIAYEHPIGSPDFAVCGEALGKKLSTPDRIAFRERFQIHHKYRKERGSVHGGVSRWVHET